MNLEEFKLVSKEQILEYGLSIPYGSTYDSNNNELTFKDSKGYWNESTYNSNSNLLTHKTSKGYWAEETYNSNDNLLTFKDSDGYWAEFTYDSNNNELTHKNSTGLYGIVLFNGSYTLYYNKTNNKYKAGCQELIYEECLAFYERYGKKHQNADKMLEAIKEHHNSLK